jgi:putative ATPase
VGLFSHLEPKPSKAVARPLADRIRPATLEEFAGQEHILGPGKPLRRQIENDQIGSLILWGPPGSGKTTLAQIIAKRTRAEFIPFSAVTSGIKEIKAVMADAEKASRYGRRAILFVDEIHRFNKAQQDAFLPYVERGDITLIGATTENPSFEVNSALLSRCRVYTLKALTTGQVVTLLERALADAERGLGGRGLHVGLDLLRQIAVYSSGDARAAFNTLEAAVAAAGDGGAVTAEIVEAAIQRKILLYDKAGEQHFNLISALHKSVRNSDPDAAIYWLARMLESGEDPLYIARRLIRMASEDIGLADPQALPITVAAMQAVDFVGMPEGGLALAEAAIHLCLAPKSNALLTAYGAALEDVAHTAADPVPLHLRNPVTPLMKQEGYGRGYQYAHDLPGKVAGDMSCLPENLAGREYYQPTSEGWEEKLRARLAEIRGPRQA